jgi:hypothetical protein
LIACTQLLLQVYVMPQVILYAMLQFGWTAYENGLYVSALSLSRFPLMVVLLPLLSKKFNPTSKAEETEASSSTVVENPEDMIRSARFDVWMIRIGAVVECVCFVTSALAVTSSQYAASGIIQGLAILSQPSMRSLLSSLVDPSEIGELMGALAILESFAGD